MWRPPSFQWFIASAACAVLGVIFSVQEYVRGARKGEPVSWGEAFGDLMPFWLSWAVITPFIWRFSRRYRIERGRRLRSILAHACASVVVAAGYPLLYILVWMAGEINTSGPVASGRQHLFYFINTHVFGVIIYWVILTIILTLDYYGRYQEERLRGSRLEAQLAQAELQTLKMQLHPHFLFNALHSVSALVLKNENREAVRMINRLGELLRLAIKDTKTQLVPLSRELDFLGRYLEIERIRFQDRLTVRMDVDPRSLDAEVPNMILQPLAENAVRHAVAPHSSAVRIEVVAVRRDGKLHLEVSDDGPGLPKGWQAQRGEGVGLANTRARLAQLYGDEYDLRLADGREGGVVVTLVIPFRAAADATVGQSEAS